ncbi:hypothetical protein TNCV_3714691, partial [Trichonephila clavipes]
GSRTNQPEDGENEDSVRHKETTGHINSRKVTRCGSTTSTRRKGLSPKLQSQWDGTVLMQFKDNLNDVVIRIRQSTNSKPRVVHYDRLAPYYGLILSVNHRVIYFDHGLV